jgi:hypothetical protein
LPICDVTAEAGHMESIRALVKREGGGEPRQPGWLGHVESYADARGVYVVCPERGTAGY